MNFQRKPVCLRELSGIFILTWGLLLINSASGSSQEEIVNSLSQKCRAQQVPTPQVLCDLGLILPANESQKLIQQMQGITCQQVCNSQDCVSVYGVTWTPQLNTTYQLWLPTIDATSERALANALHIKLSLSSCGNDLLIFLSTYTNSLYISLGTELSRSLVNPCTNLIELRGKQYLERNLPLEALQLAVGVVQEVYRPPELKMYPECHPVTVAAFVWVLVGVSILLGLAFLVFVAYQATAYRRRHYLNYRPKDLTKSCVHPQHQPHDTIQEEVDDEVQSSQSQLSRSTMSVEERTCEAAHNVARMPLDSPPPSRLRFVHRYHHHDEGEIGAGAMPTMIAFTKCSDRPPCGSEAEMDTISPYFVNPAYKELE